MNRKAVALISGGLDSILAAKVVMEQGFDIIGLYCTSAFSKSYGNEQETHAAQVSKAIGIDLRIIDMGQEYIDLVRKPAHGYGKNINPCIDCKIFMLKKARTVMEELNASFVVTGEVLGQRPMSQRRDTLQVIERDADMRGLILRPLSATLLPPTKAELDGTDRPGKAPRHQRPFAERSSSSLPSGTASADTPRLPAAACSRTRTFPRNCATSLRTRWPSTRTTSGC